MPSGFQQDSNQLKTNFYRVAIDMTGYPSSNGTTNLLTNGGITPNSSDTFSAASLPTTAEFGFARSRGNIRFENIVRRITSLTDCQILDISISEATADAQATALAFTVKFERDSFITASGTAVDGSTQITNTELKIRDEVARGILETFTRKIRVYNGTTTEDTQQSVTVTAPATATAVWEDVTVTINSDTTLVNI